MSEQPAREDQRTLDAGEIVTVAPALMVEMGPCLYVAIDGFDDPRYTIARLGGDGYQWPNVNREDLIPTAPRHIVRVTDADGDIAYIAG
ncbi:hypothetical protein AB0H28_14540 [Micromonospora sp. NPDC050980]|uniref:hypothetical protein n=1 Tax=Micromonospora sp. NPDC050980 TaxID=3155161 RepID=UPI003406E772